MSFNSLTKLWYFPFLPPFDENGWSLGCTSPKVNGTLVVVVVVVVVVAGRGGGSFLLPLTPFLFGASAMGLSVVDGSVEVCRKVEEKSSDEKLPELFEPLVVSVDVSGASVESPW